MDKSKKITTNSKQKIEDAFDISPFCRQFTINTKDVFAIWNLQNKLLFVNDRFEKLFGRKKEELENNPLKVIEWVHPSDRPGVIEFHNSEEYKNLDVLDKEFRILRPDKSVIWIWYRRSLLYNKDNKPYQYLAVISDITSRKLVELQLEDSKKMLQLILDNIPVRVFWKDINLNFLGGNKEFLKDCGVESVDEIIGKSDYDLDWRESAEMFRSDDKKVVESKTPKLNYIEEQVYDDGSKTLVKVNKIPLIDSDGEAIGILGTYENITKIRNIEKQLLLTKLSLDENKHAIFWFDTNGRVIYANDASCESLRYSKEEVLSSKIYDFIDLNINEKSWSRLWDRFKESGNISIEQYLVRKDKTKFPVELKTSYFNHQDEEYVFAYVTDITEKKQVEDKIVYRREFERLIFSISARFINLLPDDVDKNIDKALEEICQFSSNESAHIFIFNEEDKKVTLEHHYAEPGFEYLHDGKVELPFDEEYWHFKKLKSEKVISVSTLAEIEDLNFINRVFQFDKINSFLDVPLFYQGTLIGFFGLASRINHKEWDEDEIRLLKVIGDIFINSTQRKRYLNQLLDNEQTYREIYNASTNAIIISDVETGDILDVNQPMLELFKISYDEALGFEHGKYSLYPEKYNKQDALARLKKALNEPQIFEWQYKSKSGRVFWAEQITKKAVIHGHVRIMTVIRDIDDRLKTQQLLKESEEKYRMIIEGQNDLIIKVNLDSKFMFVSPSYCKLFGKTEEELLGKQFMPLVHEEDQEATELAMQKLFKPPYSCYVEQRAKTQNGWRWLSWNDTAVLDENDKVIEIIGIGRDITYQKMVENALRESEEQFRSIVQNLSDIVFLIDSKANIKYVTPSCEEYLGQTVEELLGISIYDLIHKEDRWLAEENIQVLVNGDEYVVPHELRIKHISGSWRIFEVKAQGMLKHPSIKSIIYTISDVTERKQMEKQILDAIIKTEEKERERFAKDLHDDLGPLLSSIKMYIGMLERATDKQKQQFIINNLGDIVKEAISTTKEVSNDLNPHVLNNYGLSSALDLFVEKVSSDIEIKFENNIENTRFAPAIELSLYRISKELINNTIKHAGAKNISLKIVEKDAMLSIQYADDGRGLPENALKAKKPGGMGLSNIMSRAKSLNASFNFHVNHENGFKFDMHVPIIQD
ncbi:MAG: PAS domain S-box protein [Bacteroidales bacterium]|nr:PAS domain S-box protein [Bacteroidales bacterium]MBN2820612.1 PAS domain S-box protein [Bacteroidales bacterium]